MKTFASAFSLTLLLAGRVVGTPIAAPSAVAVVAASNSTTATCQCEAVICLQSWPESCNCQNNAKIDCYNKCGGDYPTLATCE